MAPDSLLLESFNYEPPRWTPRIISPTPIRPCTDALQSTAKYLERLVEHGENARDLSDIDISLTQPIDLGSLSSERRAMSEPGSFSSENSDRLELGISQEHYSLSENSCNRSFTGYNHQLEGTRSHNIPKLILTSHDYFKDFPEYSPSQLFAVPDTRLNCLEVESVDQRCIGPFYFPQCTSPFLTSNPPTHSLTFDVCIPAPFYSLLGHVGHEVENQCMPGTLGIDVQ